jgi:hypothetical protein
VADEDTASPPTGSASPPTGSAHPDSVAADLSDLPDSDEGGEGTAEDEDDIPPAPLWAMTNRMHSLRRTEPGEESYIRRRVGDDDALYVIDDGPDHCMIGRRVGHAPDGCVYCLVARITLEQYADLVAGELSGRDVFSEARDISLCGVFEEEGAASQVFLVQHYRRPRDVPADYLPPSPFLEFTDDPEEEG